MPVAYIYIYIYIYIWGSYFLIKQKMDKSKKNILKLPCLWRNIRLKMLENAV
jgi:hypothetical protein